MIDFRPIFLVLGLLLSTLAIVMLVPAAVDALTGNPDWQVFTVAAGVTLFIGVALSLTSRAGGAQLNVRQAFIMTTLAWVVLTAFAALPFTFSQLKLSYTDAFFEAMSGITTTGSTVITGLDFVPPGLLLWRALLQWLGGIGIIVMAIAILPLLRVGGMQLFRMESSDRSEKAMPRTAQVAAGIGVIYLSLTAILAAALWLAGMSGFDAVTHAMTTLSTGGYSTHDASIAYFKSPLIDAIITLGMLAGSMPFVLYLLALHGRPGELFRDNQVQAFLVVVMGIVVMVAGWLWIYNGIEPLTALRYAAFNIISTISTTGYANAPYDKWGPFAVTVFYFVIFAGGCAGSTAGGLKTFRFLVLYKAAATQFQTLVQPHGVFTATYNNQPISNEIIRSTLTFFFVFGMTFAVLSMSLALLGLDFLTAVSAAAQAISNVGPGLGPVIGPAGNYAGLPTAAKWLLTAGMLLGRLELFTVMVLFTRTFWKA